MRNICLSGLLLAILLCLPAGLFGQNSSAISGTVTEPTQAVVPNASITIVNAEAGVTVWRGVTNESGVYRAPELRSGRYNVTVEMQGFKQAAVNGINLEVDQRASINVTLQPGGTTESITVQGSTEGLLATETSSLGNVITPAQVQNLPLPNRNILNLLAFAGDAAGSGAEPEGSTIDAGAVRADESNLGQRLLRAGRPAALRLGVGLRHPAGGAPRLDRGDELRRFERRAPASQSAL